MKIKFTKPYYGFLGGQYVSVDAGEEAEVSEACAKVAFEIGVAEKPKAAPNKAKK